MAATANDPFDLVPNELVVYLTGFLPVQDIITLKSVSRRLRDIVIGLEQEGRWSFFFAETKQCRAGRKTCTVANVLRDFAAAGNVRFFGWLQGMPAAAPFLPSPNNGSEILHIPYLQAACGASNGTMLRLLLRQYRPFLDAAYAGRLVLFLGREGRSDLIHVLHEESGLSPRDLLFRETRQYTIKRRLCSASALLEVAASTGNVDLFRWLQEMPEAEKFLPTPKMMRLQLPYLAAASYAEDPAMFRFLVGQYSSLLGISYVRKLIIDLCERGRLDIIRVIFEESGIPPKSLQQSNFTTHAAESDQVAVLRYLLYQGCPWTSRRKRSWKKYASIRDEAPDYGNIRAGDFPSLPSQ